MNNESVVTMVNSKYVWALHGVILVPLLAYHYFHACLYYLLAAAFLHALYFLRGFVVEQLGEGTAETFSSWVIKISFFVSLFFVWHIRPDHRYFSTGGFIIKLMGLQIRCWPLCLLGIYSIPCLPRAFRKLVADAETAVCILARTIIRRLRMSGSKEIPCEAKDTPLKCRTGHWPLNSKRKRNNQTAKYGPCRQRSRKNKTSRIPSIKSEKPPIEGSLLSGNPAASCWHLPKTAFERSRRKHSKYCIPASK